MKTNKKLDSPIMMTHVNDIVKRAVRLELIQKPESLLRERHGQDINFLILFSVVFILHSHLVGRPPVHHPVI